ncbi:MAG TPA: bifunctional 4-hydroxy-2-oxoglutarate aldolase/2-dehydro-3-deoxy-phosphogluconate aldolase [Terriglobales bacterium]|jgi:2-dehydro-3-deoxyphosphogluconate aldolase/(4S)-4-hydroxy-2-oxoglutarate aldolase
MTKEEVRQKIVDVGVVPVIRASSGKQAMMASEAVAAGGIPIVEITMTVPGAIDVIAEFAKTSGKQILIGAGTVLDAQTAQRCFDAGAQFLVSPGFDLGTVQLANKLGKLIMAGALTPTEVIAAWKAGSDFVKVFPCGTVGGAKYIKALKAPLPQIPMVPTGGVNLDTAADFIRAGSAALGVGGELVSASALKSGNTSEITEAAKKYVSIVRDARDETKP